MSLRSLLNPHFLCSFFPRSGCTYLLVCERTPLHTASLHLGRAIAQAVSRWLPTATARVQLVKWDLWWTKWCWGRFSLSTSVFPAYLHSAKFSIIIIIRGRYNRSFSGRRAEWIQFRLHPPLCELKKNHFIW
jgi:hypothetical protein